jgi:hypothetical protein
MQRWLAYAAGAILAWTGGLAEVRAEIEILYLEPTTTSPVLSTISTESEDFRRSEVVAGTGGWRRVARADSYSGFIREEALDAGGQVRPGTPVYLTPSANAAELTAVADGDEIRVNFVDDWTEISIRKSIPGFVRPSAPPPTDGFLPPRMEEPAPPPAEEVEIAPEPAAPEPEPDAPRADTAPLADEAPEAADTPVAAARPEEALEPEETAAVLLDGEDPGTPEQTSPAAAVPSPEPVVPAPALTEPVETTTVIEEIVPAEPPAPPATPEQPAPPEPTPSAEPTAAPGAEDAAGIPPREEAAVEEEIAAALPPEVPVRILPVDRSLPTRPADATPRRAEPDRQPVPVRVERRVPAPPGDILRTFRGRLELNRSTLGIAREFRLQLVNSRGKRIAFIDDSEVASASWIDRIGERVRVIGAASPSSGTGRFVIRAVNIIPW